MLTLSNVQYQSLFEPTYEELKATLVRDFNMHHAGFEPTYEELKASASWNLRVNVYWFEPTYEELKASMGSEGRGGCSCLSLPMRN